MTSLEFVKIMEGFAWEFNPEVSSIPQYFKKDRTRLYADWIGIFLYKNGTRLAGASWNMLTMDGKKVLFLRSSGDRVSLETGRVLRKKEELEQ
jgi:hypothetical protein